MRALRYFLYVIGMSLWLAATPFAFKHGKLLVRSNVEDAEVYLEETFLARTDSHRQLLVEEVPEGTYKVRLRKAGYTDFHATITLKADQTVTLPAPLQAVPVDRKRPLEMAKDPPTKPPPTRRRTEPPARAAPERSPVSVAQPAPTQSATTAIWTTPGASSPPFIAPPPTRNSHDKKQATGPFPWSRLGWIVAGLAAWIAARNLYRLPWRPRRLLPPNQPNSEPWATGEEAPTPSSPQNTPADPDPMGSQPSPTQPTAAPERPSTPHGFMRDLRRKEELFEAGLISESHPPKKEQAQDRSVPTTIEVSREEYRYEENSD